MKRNWFWTAVITLFVGMVALVTTQTSTVRAAAKTYTIGTDVTFAPFEFANKDNKYVGIDIDLMHAIAKEEGFNVNIKPLGFNAAVQSLEAGQIDGTIAGMSITPERKAKFEMSDPTTRPGLWAR